MKDGGHGRAHADGRHDMTDDLIRLFVLAMPVAAIAWTVTHEEVFKELRDYCVARSRARRPLAVRKFFYLFTCEYCFSHWVTLALLLVDALHAGLRRLARLS